VTNAVAFFFGEGLFFLGLSLGILGSTTESSSRQSAWILLTIAVLSFLVAGLLIAYGRRSLAPSSANITPLRPLPLARAFDSLLQTPQASTLLAGENFSSELVLVISSTQLEIPAGKTLILQHFAGLGASVEVELQSSALRTGDLLRVNPSGHNRALLLRSIDVSEDSESAAPYTERSPQILAHFIDSKKPS